MSGRRRRREEEVASYVRRYHRHVAEDGDTDVDGEEDTYVPLSKRKVDQMPVRRTEEDGIEGSRVSLLEQAMREPKRPLQTTNKTRLETLERDIIEVDKKQPLLPAHELARDTIYEGSIKTGWTAPAKIIQNQIAISAKLRKKFHIIVEGDDVPPPIQTFVEMKMPREILSALSALKIRKPTPIQMQGFPVVLSGRDMIGVAFTGSGKTLVFVIPMLLMSVIHELHMPLIGGEGPLGLILCPSRELCRQTYETVQTFAEYWKDRCSIRTLLCMGQVDMKEQSECFRRGVHIVVATPGRLKDLLSRRKLNLNFCRFVCFDEADRLVDLGFEEDIRDILSHFRLQRQTVMFSATMPERSRVFMKSAMISPIVVSVGRAGAANLDVIQEVEYVKGEAKMLYLLECLQKTAPLAVIFSEKKSTVDEIHEYLLLKGVEAVALHGDKSQKEREEAIKLFKKGMVDVLVANDVAAKGLHFENVQHVINFDVPKEISMYVHRVGRTGRCGKTGLSTTFINRNVPESVLLDLKRLLVEARQRVPPVLQTLHDPHGEEIMRGNAVVCVHCGNLHRTDECPLLMAENLRRIGTIGRDITGRGDM